MVELVHDGGQPEDTLAWDGRFELSLATFIIRQLAADPPPSRSAVAADARLYADALAQSGRGRLEAAGASAVRVVEQEPV